MIVPVGDVAHGAAEHGGHALSLGLEWALVVLSVAVAGIGILLAWQLYFKDAEGLRATALAQRFNLAYRTLLDKYWVDELYEAVIVKPLHRLSTPRKSASGSRWRPC